MYNCAHLYLNIHKTYYVMKRLLQIFVGFFQVLEGVGLGLFTQRLGLLPF